MAIDKDLFLYDLAIVAILKDEGHYLKEWLDYHLLAGVDHFYLYDNDSTDNQAEIAKPYVEAGLVDYFYAPGNKMQFTVYNEAVQKYRFLCRHMAFIDLDEFIFPKNTTGTIAEKVDDILKDFPEATGLSIHWQCFGSNGQNKADYSRGVLERFTRRAKKDFLGIFRNYNNNRTYRFGNSFLKTILNPRRIKEMYNHYAIFFEGGQTVDENGVALIPTYAAKPIFAEKIVINHYFTKSKEEFYLKLKRGRAYSDRNWPEELFEVYDCNDEFDDGILKYRAAREKIFSFKNDTQELNRLTEALTKTLSEYAADEISDLETALTCRALSHYLKLELHEEASLAAILKSLNGLKIIDTRLLLSELPNLLILPYPVVKEIRDVSIQIISQTMDFLREKGLREEFLEWDYLRRLLQAWR